MALYTKNHTRLAVEELEARRLLSANLTPTLTAPVPSAPVGQPSQSPAPSVNHGSALATNSQPMVWTYDVVSLRNATNLTLHVQFRWSADSPWTSYTLPPHTYRYFYYTSNQKLTPQVRFATDPTTNAGPVVESLRYKTVRTGGTPSYGDAYHYAFALRGHTLTLGPSAA